MKHVFTNSMVAHTWIHPRCENDHGRSGNGNLFFKGPTIYSYGRHFPIASIHTGRSGQRCVLFTTDSYAQTTACHMGLVRRAIPNTTPVFYVPIVRPYLHLAHWHQYNLAHYQQIYNQLILSASRVNINSYSGCEGCLNEANDITLRSQAYCDFFGVDFDLRVREISLERRKQITDRWERLNSPEAEAKRERSRAKREEREERKREREAEAAKEHIEDWRNGGRAFTSMHRFPCMLRVIGDKIQTSHGADFPVEDAKRAWILIKAIRHRGQGWRRNGEHIPLGQFQVDSVSPRGDVVTGCHRVRFEEIERCAQSLGLV